MPNIYYISAFTGAGTILFSFILIYAKKITIDKVASNPNIREEAIKVEIFDKIKISSNYPAISLFIIGLLLIAIPLYLCSNLEKQYTVIGFVKKSDSPESGDIIITTKYPANKPQSNGELINLRVSRSIDGTLPTLSFNHPSYSTAGVDLNNPEKVEITGRIIKIKKDVILNRIP